MRTDYQEIVQFLYQRLPVFHRVGAAAYKPGLETITRFCQAVGQPHQKFPSIHVAGTNGKGSSSHSIAAILQSAGYKTGLFTSPHLVDFRERFKINGIMVSKEEVIETVQNWIPHIDELEPSFFEISTALGFHFFAQHQVDIAVIEVGMGGRLDSTNIIDPLISLISNISLDHQKFLGETLEAIAGEKAGIIKPHRPCVISEKQVDIQHVFEQKAKREKSPILFATRRFEVKLVERLLSGQTVRVLDNENRAEHIYHLSLGGNYQLKNLPGILDVISELKKIGWQIPQKSIEIGLSHVQEITGLYGRWQVLAKKPLVICDTGHNEAGVKEVVEQISGLKVNQKWIIWGMVNDKDHSAIIDLLPADARYIITEPNIPRKLPKEDLQPYFNQAGLQSELSASVPEAIALAQAKAGIDDLIFIGGSTFTVADIPFQEFYEGI